MLFENMPVKRCIAGQVYWIKEDESLTQAKTKSSCVEIAKTRPWLVVNVHSGNYTEVLIMPVTTTTLEEAKNGENINPIFVDPRREYAMVKMSQLKVVSPTLLGDYYYSVTDDLIKYIKEYLAKLVGVSDEIVVEENKVALADIISEWDTKKCKEYLKDSEKMGDTELCEKYSITNRDIGPLIRHVQMKIKKTATTREKTTKTSKTSKAS